MSESRGEGLAEAVAIVGMAGRFPRAGNVAEFWRNVRDGVETVDRFSVEDLEVPGAAGLAGRPDYVKARPILEGVDRFDASFFGILPKEAELIDPQHRVFLECAWEALEDAGHDPQAFGGDIAVFAGCSANTYFLNNICKNRDFIEDFTGTYQVGCYTTLLGTIPDFLASRVSYKLNLRGPSFTIQCGCSTSLVAICQAAQSLLAYQCDMALAGGASITFPQRRGYLYEEGGMVSPDGSCRTFDAEARGTVFGSGAGVVLLRRLEDAIAEGDHVYGVIRGFAVNNDGSSKAGFTAPSVEGQARVISMAHAVAGVHPESIGFVEAHGTATPLGDPIEFAALTRAFRSGTDARNFCAIGSVKASVGHLDAASGVAGLINAVQMLVHRQIPPLLHFRSPNPEIDLAGSPFYVNRELSRWEEGGSPRRAGVSSFGVGGTNAHVVLEEAPARAEVATPRAEHLLVLSARTEVALEAATANLAGHLGSRPELTLDSVAYTLQAGRRAFEHRRFVVCGEAEEAIGKLEGRLAGRVTARSGSDLGRPVVFMFPGQGSQVPGMGLALYREDPGFRRDVDGCAEILEPHLGLDLRAALFADGAARDGGTGDLRQTRLAQPSLFVIGYALARLWIRWGIRPSAMIGHSVGEVVAACLSGVLSLEDSLEFIAARGRLMQGLPPGAMLSVRLGEAEVVPLLNGTLSLAASNGPRQCVVSGPEPAIEALARDLDGRRVANLRLRAGHAFHSRMMDPLIQPLATLLGRFRFREPTLPFISTVSGTWVAPGEATDPAYWARHAREPVRFSEGLRELLDDPGRIFLEVGPGETLCSLLRQQARGPDGRVAIASLPDPGAGRSSIRPILEASGRLWLEGLAIDWDEMAGPERRRCPLPTYPFERERHWVDPPEHAVPATAPGHLEPAPSVHPEEVAPMPKSMEGTGSPTGPAVAPRRAILSRLIGILEEHSGLPLSGSDPTASFLEMGFDSLILTQVAQALHAEFGLKVTFRMLLDRLSTPDLLAAHLEEHLPPAPTPCEPAPAPQPFTSRGQTPGHPAGSDRPGPVADVPATERAVGEDPGALESVVKEQLRVMSQLMARQLEAFRGSSPTMPLVEPAAPDPSARREDRPSEATNDPTSPPKSPEPSPPARTEFEPFGPYKPIRPGQVGGLTDRQSSHIAGLIERYTARTAQSKEHVQRHRPTLADPRVASGFRAQWKEMVYPLVTIRSRGPRLWDLDGNEYIDILNGFGAIMLGHAPDFVTSAVGEQLELGFETGPQTPLAGKVADQVCRLTGMERAAFCNTGSEAVMAAIRIARTVTARKRVVLFSGAYHGAFEEVLVRGGRKGTAPQALPVAPGIPRDMVANVTVLEYAAPEALEYLRAHAGELAAVLVEPVQSRHPDLQPAEFLKEVRRITADSGAALIFDEIVTGFRVHPGGAQAYFGIEADLATYGKVLGGGLPVGIVAGRARFMDALDGGMWSFGDASFPEVGVTFFAGTFVRHPLALAAASAVLDHLEARGPDLQRELNEKTSGLVREINLIFGERGVPARVEHFGSIFYLSMPADLRFGSLLFYHLREKGVHLQEGFPCFLTTAHSDRDIEFVARCFRESVEEMQDGELLPGSRRAASRPSSPASQIKVATMDEEQAPLTESQTEIWLSASLGDDESCAFNESFTIHLRGPLDRSAIRGAVRQLVERHSSLRARFDAGGEVQYFPTRVPIEVTFVDLSTSPAGEVDDLLGQIIREDACTPFKLESGPLVRAQLICLGHDRHALVFTSHHIVCDGWSTNVLLDELGALYRSTTSGSPEELAAPAQFADYARSLRSRIRQPEHERTEAWWVEKFSTPPIPIELPVDRPRGLKKLCRGATARAVVDAVAYRGIKQFGARHGCTLFATLLSGLEILLHRLSGQSEIVVGIPAAGQSMIEGPPMVGHCVNFLLLRCSMGGDPEVSELMDRVRGMVLDAYDHQDFTYGSLLAKLAIPRDPARLPLVEVQFNLERVGAGLSLPGLEAVVEPNPKSFVNFDLFFNVVESGEGLVIHCDFNTDLLDRETVDRWLGHYRTILDAMAEGPGRRVSSVPLMAGEELRRIVSGWNATSADYPRDRLVHQLFEEQAARTPGAVAVVFEGRETNYAQLDEAASRVAGRLRGLGIGPETPVGLCLDRSAEMVIGLLGILKSGGAYLPLDPGYPPDRISAVIRDSGLRWLLTSRELAPGLGTIPAQLIPIDEALRGEAPKAHAVADASPGSLAYLIYTSGSTGRPKGVAVEHRQVVNFLSSMARRPGLGPEDVLLAVTTPSFDIATLELLLPLTAGARVVVASREDVTDGHRLMALLDSAGVTVLQATPATWRLLLEAGWAGSPKLKALCGGEALPRDLADALLARTSTLWNMYGPTETTVWSSVLQVAPGAGPVPIGPPISNTSLYVLDALEQPVPVGVPGELCIGGEGVARGYWGDDRLTGGRFVPDRFGGDGRSRLYRTGDLVRYLSDGTLEFLGRLDTQVKVRGFRIETSEVEAVIAQVRGVRECVVVAAADPSGEKRLVAYMVMGPEIQAGELRAHVASRLPDYMVPSIFTRLEAMPRTPNGKVDRRGLPDPDPSLSQHRGGEFAGPRTDAEAKLVEICSEVLGVVGLGIHDNLFDAGADLPQVARIIARSAEAGIRLSMERVVSARTVAAIVEASATPEVRSAATAAPELAPISRQIFRLQRPNPAHLGRQVVNDE